MRCLSRAVLLFAALSSVSVSAKPGGVGRFSINKRSTPTTPHNLTSGEIYVRSLIAKKPTRRSTAQRRQTSPIPNAGIATLGTDVSGTYTPTGNLLYNTASSDWTVSSTSGSTLILPSTPSSGSDNALKYVDGTYVSLSSCDYLSQSTYEAFYLGTGSTSYLCVSNVDLGTDAPSSTPSVRLDVNGNGQVYETAVWNVGSTGSPQWTNSATFGNSVTPLQLVYVTSAYLWPTGKLLAVADVSAFRSYLEALQITNGLPIDLFPLTIQELVINVSTT